MGRTRLKATGWRSSDSEVQKPLAWSTGSSCRQCRAISALIANAVCHHQFRRLQRSFINLAISNFAHAFDHAIFVLKFSSWKSFEHRVQTWPVCAWEFWKHCVVLGNTELQHWSPSNTEDDKHRKHPDKRRQIKENHFQRWQACRCSKICWRFPSCRKGPKGWKMKNSTRSALKSEERIINF